jgi:hypothetical protein
LVRLSDGSGVSREIPAPFCEGLELKCSGLLTYRVYLTPLLAKAMNHSCPLCFSME